MRKIVSIDSLSRDVQDDIVYMLSDEGLGVSGEEQQVVGDNILGLHPSTPVVLTSADPKKMLRQFEKQRHISNRNVDALTKLMKSGVNLDPILILNGRFLDGGHRVVAAVKLKRKSIPAVDIGHLVDMDWESWLDGDNIQFDLENKS